MRFWTTPTRKSRWPGRHHAWFCKDNANSIRILYGSCIKRLNHVYMVTGDASKLQHRSTTIPNFFTLWALVLRMVDLTWSSAWICYLMNFNLMSDLIGSEVLRTRFPQYLRSLNEKWVRQAFHAAHRNCSEDYWATEDKVTVICPEILVRLFPTPHRPTTWDRIEQLRLVSDVMLEAAARWRRNTFSTSWTAR